MTRRFLSPQEIGDIAGCSPYTVRRAIAREEIPGAKKVGRDWHVPTEAGMEWAKSYEPYNWQRRRAT